MNGSSVDKRPIFVVITAETCGHCNVFKTQVWPSLEAALKEQNKVKVFNINVSQMGSPVPPEYPSDLNRYANWYPTFILCTPSSWYSGGKLEAFVFNGNYVDGQIRPVRGGPSHNKENLINWINVTILSNPSFSYPIIQRSNVNNRSSELSNTQREGEDNSLNKRKNGYIPLKSPVREQTQIVKHIPTYGTMKFVPNVF